MKDWMCEGLCGIGKEDECSVDADIASCKACTCASGTAGMGSDCPVAGAELCLSCDVGYTLTQGVYGSNSCVSNICTCNQGTAAIGSDCITDNTEVCTACETGFTLTGTVCESTVTVHDTITNDMGCDATLFENMFDDLPLCTDEGIDGRPNKQPLSISNIALIWRTNYPDGFAAGVVSDKTIVWYSHRVQSLTSSQFNTKKQYLILDLRR